MENSNMATNLILITTNANLEEVEEIYIKFNAIMDAFDEAMVNTTNYDALNALSELKLNIQELAKPEPVIIEENNNDYTEEPTENPVAQEDITP